MSSPRRFSYVSFPRRSVDGEGEPETLAPWANLWQSVFGSPTAENATHGGSMSSSVQFASPVWMPDEKCNHCYECTAHFSAIRRKHHCRMCGNIFCHQCAPHFVPSSFLRLAAQASNERKSRVCEFCHQRLRTEFPSLAPVQSADFVESSSPSNSIPLHPITEAPRARSRSKFSPWPSPRSIVLGPLRDQVLDKDMIDLHGEEWGHLKQLYCHHFVWSVYHAARTLSSGNRVLGKDILTDICSLARTAVSILSPPVFGDEKMQRILADAHWRNDILALVKIKKFPAPDVVFESRYVRGVVFEHHVTHAKMKTQLTDCRVLLLSGSLDFHQDRRLVSLDVLRTQEIPYFQLLVEKIAVLKPPVQVMLCGSFVAQSAQELLFRQGITLLLNVPIKILQAVSRITGARILPSLDFGDVSLYYQHKSQPDEPETGNGIATLFSIQNLGPRTLVVIEGTIPQYGGTICISSADKQLLSLVKQVLKWAIRLAYILQLQTEFLFEHWCDSPRELLLADEPTDVRAWCLTCPNSHADIHASEYDALFRSDSQQKLFTWDVQRLEVLVYVIKDEEYATTECRNQTYDCLAGGRTLCEWLQDEVFSQPHGTENEEGAAKPLRHDGQVYPALHHALCFQHLRGRVMVTLQVEKQVPTTSIRSDGA